MTEKRSLVAKDRVSLKWQALFSVIGLLDIWAFYRIQKLRRAMLLVVVPGIMVWFVVPGLVLGAGHDIEGYAEMEEYDEEIHEQYLPPSVPVLGTVITVGFAAWSIYLIVRWSKEWNRQFA